MADITIGDVVVPEATIAALKVVIGTNTRTDEDLAAILIDTRNEDGTFNIDRAAAAVWRGKAAEYAELVTVSESGSSRNLSDLHKNALAMAKQFDDRLLAVLPDTGRRRSRTRAIIRGES